MYSRYINNYNVQLKEKLYRYIQNSRTNKLEGNQRNRKIKILHTIT